MSNEEPEYLKALKRTHEQQKAAAPVKAPSQGAKKGPPTPAEREAVRWGREVGGKDITIAPSLSPESKCAILLHPITPFGAPRITLEGAADREALAERIRAAIGAGENVMGCYELTTGRPLSHAVADGKVTFTPGQPRAVPKPSSPERMVRQATRQAELLAKTRKVDDFSRRPGPGGPGGPGGGRGGQGGRGGAGGAGGGRGGSGGRGR